MEYIASDFSTTNLTQIIMDLVGLPDIRYTQVSRGDIKRAIDEHSKTKMREEVLASRKVEDRATEDPKHRTHFTYTTLPNSKIKY